MSSDKANPVNTPKAFAKRYFVAPRQEIAYLRFILESYDGLAFMRTLDKKSGLVEIAYPPEREADAGALIDALRVETGMQQAPAPEQVPPL